MTLYVKAGPDGKSLGDCPFAHYVRMVLEVKGLEYELKPSVQDTKPSWLIEYYDGKMPALRRWPKLRQSPCRCCQVRQGCRLTPPC